MANGLTLFDPTTVSQRALAVAREAGRALTDELSGGILGGFGVLAYRGKVWRIKFGGEEKPIMAPDPNSGIESPVASIPVVIIAATSHITKNWYEAGYTEGSNAAPDCASSNGIVPDASSPKKQASVCATCPHNQFGSRITPDGKGKGKACGDSKRLAIVPAADIKNESFGGPMLLRIPAASLSELQAYAGLLQRNGLPFYGVSTWLYFDGDEAYPRIMFKARAPLSDAEFDTIMEYRSDDRVARILNSVEAVPAGQPEQLYSSEAPGAAPAASAVPPVAQPAPQPAPAPVQAAPAPQPEPAPQPAPAPAPAPVDPEAEMRARIEAQVRAEMAAKAAPAPQAAPTPEPAPTPTPAPAPVQNAFSPDPGALASFGAPAPVAQAAPQAAPTPAAAPGDFTSYLDALVGG